MDWIIARYWRPVRAAVARHGERDGDRKTRFGRMPGARARVVKLGTGFGIVPSFQFGSWNIRGHGVGDAFLRHRDRSSFARLPRFPPCRLGSRRWLAFLYLVVFGSLVGF